MSSKNLSEKIMAEEQKLKALKSKRDDIDKKIQNIEASLEKYKLMANNTKFIELQNAAEETGVSVEDLLTALQTGSLTELQNRISKQQQNENTENLK